MLQFILVLYQHDVVVFLLFLFFFYRAKDNAKVSSFNSTQCYLFCHRDRKKVLRGANKKRFPSVIRLRLVWNLPASWYRFCESTAERRKFLVVARSRAFFKALSLTSLTNSGLLILLFFTDLIFNFLFAYPPCYRLFLFHDQLCFYFSFSL